MFTLFGSKKIKIIKTKLKKENKLDIKGNLFAKNEDLIFFKLGRRCEIRILIQRKMTILAHTMYVKAEIRS